ncbi:MAG TPA: TadE/TadG family type IV pilus assembly protein [Terriglobia bacterium]|nr:TadE/TadG family type IV pilus assembly protein [Terriglobia bacterium]
MLRRGRKKTEKRNGLRKTCALARLPFFGRFSIRSLKAPGRLLRATEAAELVEFALLLPILLVMVVGIMDFATAYNLQQKLANAAREGARMATSQPRADLTDNSCSGTPCSVQAVRDDVVTYLQQAGVDTSFIAVSANYTASTPYTATYYTSSGGANYGLKIVRADPVDINGVSVFETHVTLTYPYDWTFGFNHIIRLLIPSASSLAQIGIEADATMVDLT